MSTHTTINTDPLDEITHQIAELEKRKLHEERKLRLLTQKEELKRRIIELNLLLSNEGLTCEEREPIYLEIIKVQESLLFIGGYYAKLIMADLADFQ